MPKPKVYVAVGHGVRPDGTQDNGASVPGGWSEQSAGDVITRACVVALRATGKVEVFDESYTDDPNFQGSPRAAHEWGADYAIAIHHDWSQGFAGAFCFWDTDAGKRFADDVYDAVGDAGFPQIPSWHKYRNNLGFLNSLERYGITATLIEVGRVGQPEIDTDDERRKMGRAIAAGILTHLGIDTAEPSPTPTPPTSEEDELMAIRIPDRFGKPGDTLSLEDTLALMRDDAKHARQFAAEARRDAAVARELATREARQGSRLTAAQVDEIVDRVTKATADA